MFDSFVSLLQDHQSAQAASLAHAELSAALYQAKVLAPDTASPHIGKVHKRVLHYEEEERDEFARLIEVRSKAFDKAGIHKSDKAFKLAKFRSKFIKPAVKLVDEDLREKLEDICKQLHVEEEHLHEQADDLENVEAMHVLFKQADEMRALIELLEVKFVHFRHKFLRAANADLNVIRKQHLFVKRG